MERPHEPDLNAAWNRSRIEDSHCHNKQSRWLASLASPLGFVILPIQRPKIRSHRMCGQLAQAFQ